ncbi:MAG: peptide deformylase [Rhodobiaceae bacterium]|jgi:peptide deformylase|nr:peptide deformylase [Alphaproteobacteria bacterium]
MTIRPIIEVPDKRLRTISKPVDAVTDEMRVLMDDMLETMYDAKGIGLAAIQVGVAQRIIVMDLSPSLEDVETTTEDEASADDFDNESASKQDRYDLSSYAHEGPRYFVNPEIVWASEETNNYQEGCLSVPGFYDDVARPAQCRVKFLDYDGKAQEIDCDGLLATCIQHEMDHLNGIVFLDHLSRLKRDRILKKLRKAEREQAVSA